MENSKNLARAFFVLLAMVFMANIATAAPDKDMVNTFGCDALAGESIPQPAGSDISFCCFPDKCYICDEDFKNCEASLKGDAKPGDSIRSRLTKPVLNTDTIIMQPDTNTTVGTGAKPLGGKLIMRNVIQK